VRACAHEIAEALVSVGAPEAVVVGHDQKAHGTDVERVEKVQGIAALGQGGRRDVLQGDAQQATAVRVEIASRVAASVVHEAAPVPEGGKRPTGRPVVAALSGGLLHCFIVVPTDDRPVSGRQCRRARGDAWMARRAFNPCGRGVRLRSSLDVARPRRACHRTAAFLPQMRNFPTPISAPRQPGARRRRTMEIVGIVMLGSIALWFSQQFDRHDW